MQKENGRGNGYGNILSGPLQWAKEGALLNQIRQSLASRIPVATVSLISPKLPGHRSENETLSSLQELKELCQTLNLDHRQQYYQKKNDLNPATLLGVGKIQEITKLAKDEGVELLIFDFELSASQMRNIKKLTGLDVMDRCHIILEIFARHAHTKEAKIQVEISRLEYLLPRLSTLWTHFTRQKGGIGLKGEGEQQLELDRRLIRSRIQLLKKQLKTVENSQKQQGKRRQKKSITAALMGYTNTGKSSLLNRLCQVDILEEDKLFATLDSTFRTLNPDTKPPMILIDTVGFIQNLPTTLINGFKTTLESAVEAELLLIVCDISHPHFEKHLQVMRNVLSELDLDKKDQFLIFNKKDLLTDQLQYKIAKKKYPDSYLVSAHDENDMGLLREKILNYFLDKQKTYELFVPYGNGDAHSQISFKSNILTTIHHETGIFYKIKTPDFIFESMGLHHLQTGPQSLLEEGR